jgi:hypothetical protein
MDDVGSSITAPYASANSCPEEGPRQLPAPGLFGLIDALLVDWYRASQGVLKLMEEL